MIVTYTLSLTITRPVEAGDSTAEENARYMMGSKAQRELEHEVLKVLRRLDGDCDIEVMNVQADSE